MKRKYDDFLKINLPKTSFIARFLLICGLMFVFSVAGKAVTLWQNTDTTTIIANNSISCNLAGIHRDTSYWRAFTPSAFGQIGTFTVTGVRIGVEDATAGSGGNQPITVRIYTNSGGAFPAGTRTLIGTTATTIANGNLFFQNFAVTAASQPVTTEIVVEIFTPSGEAANNSFFIGSNGGGQSATSYISAASCGAPGPTNVAVAGAPNMHTLIGLIGTTPTAANASVSGRAVTADGRGIGKVQISITLPNGEVRTALTGSFGYYRFDNIPVNRTVIVSATAKRFAFSQPSQVLNVTEDTDSVDFVAGDSSTPNR